MISHVVGRHQYTIVNKSLLIETKNHNGFSKIIVYFNWKWNFKNWFQFNDTTDFQLLLWYGIQTVYPQIATNLSISFMFSLITNFSQETVYFSHFPNHSTILNRYQNDIEHRKTNIQTLDFFTIKWNFPTTRMYRYQSKFI